MAHQQRPIERQAVDDLRHVVRHFLQRRIALGCGALAMTQQIEAVNGVPVRQALDRIVPFVMAAAQAMDHQHRAPLTGHLHADGLAAGQSQVDPARRGALAMPACRSGRPLPRPLRLHSTRATSRDLGHQREAGVRGGGLC